MKSQLLVATALFSAFISVVNAGVVLIPITEDEVVKKMKGDCYFGVVTPEGCG